MAIDTIRNRGVGSGAVLGHLPVSEFERFVFFYSILWIIRSLFFDCIKEDQASTLDKTGRAGQHGCRRSFQEI